MMQLKDIVVYAQNPFTNQLMSGTTRKAMVEYNENDVIEAIYVASPGLNGPKDESGNGILVTRMPVIFTVAEDATLSVAISALNSDNTQERLSAAEFNEKYKGLPVTM